MDYSNTRSNGHLSNGSASAFTRQQTHPAPLPRTNTKGSVNRASLNRGAPQPPQANGTTTSKLHHSGSMPAVPSHGKKKQAPPRPPPPKITSRTQVIRGLRVVPAFAFLYHSFYFGSGWKRYADANNNNHCYKSGTGRKSYADADDNNHCFKSGTGQKHYADANNNNHCFDSPTGRKYYADANYNNRLN